VFSAAIAALERLGGLIRDAVQIPKRRRKEYLDAVTDAFTLLQTAVLLVETRLGDLLRIQDDPALDNGAKQRRFVQELAGLDNTKRWLELEREVALCRSLQLTSNRLGDAANVVVNGLAFKDQQAIYSLIDDVLERERMLAEHISSSLVQLSDMAPAARASADGRAAAWRAVERQRKRVTAERRQLIEAERTFLRSL